ncbi:DUF1467 family protein [Litoreibacter roseus]|uniref:Uncharacterized protein n=1 Tax=Litoreibacter roseus TaxID=2601869 RepID=A0A6N6JDR5_9RHOB|nr:DUF1467 family protein [Litoreibacter roseus]GFE63342.1 hypothetical protein KIN_04160 [Litoreibacter roseus]
MQITSALVVFAVIWFLTLFCVLPLRMKSQGDMGQVEPGTPASAPADPQMGRKFRITTIVAFLIWVPVCLAIVYGWLSVDTINLYDWANPSD